MEPEDEKVFKNIKADAERFRFFTDAIKYTQYLPFHNSFDVNLVGYLSFKIALDNLRLIHRRLIDWPRVNLSIQKYTPYIHLIEHLLTEIKKIEKQKTQYLGLIGGNSVDKSEIADAKAMIGKKIDDSEIKDSYLINLYMIVAGAIYSKLAV